MVAVNSHSFHQFDNGTLMINSSRPLDSGEYICVAESRAGTAYSQTNLIVNGEEGKNIVLKKRCKMVEKVNNGFKQ